MAETEDLREQIAGLKSKYSGAKVCHVTVVMELADEVAHEPAIQRRSYCSWGRIRQGGCHASRA
jgi:hypothetical protein